MNQFEGNLIVDLSFNFALKIVVYCEILEIERKYVVAQQLLKAGTSIGANAHEAQDAESKADFIHKFKISAKEANETLYWLKICKAATSYPNPSNELMEEIVSIKKVLNKIIASSKRS